jgi:hypothetical protein
MIERQFKIKIVFDVSFVDMETLDNTHLSTSFMPSGHDLPH